MLISSYEFMRMLCAALVKKKKVIIDLQDVTNHIYRFKQTHKDLQWMFRDIEFRRGINNIISSNISQAINTLQLLGVADFKYGRLIIYMGNEKADEILQECPKEIREAMLELADTF